MTRIKGRFYFALLPLLWVLNSPASAATIRWFCDPQSVNLASDARPIDNRFRFELGVFTDGFVPTADNTADWSAHWVSAQRAIYKPADKLFAGQVNVTDNVLPFVAGAKAYIWGFAADTTSSQWILFSKSTWNWPQPNPVEPLGQSWYANEADQVIVGQLNSTGSPFLLKAALVSGGRSPLTTWDQWLSEELPGQAGTAVTDDPDRDGVSNILEYVFGTLPSLSNGQPRAEVFVSEVNGQPFLHMRVTHRGDHPARLTVEVSDDLVKWVSGTAVTEVVQDTDSTLVVRDLAPVGPTYPKRFMRLRAALP